MTRPVRLQRSRRAGFSLQAASRAANGLAAVNCARPSRWGNPFRFEAGDRFHPADRFAWEALPLIDAAPLRGLNLACFCRLCPAHAATGKPFDVACPDCAPCHVDSLGMKANEVAPQ